MLIETPADFRLFVAKSPIHGKGLFARDFIPEGEVLGVINGVRTSREGTYTLWVDEDYAVRIQCKFKYINHSDDPNVVLYDTLEVCAVRDIQPGEEITHNYNSGDWQEN